MRRLRLSVCSLGLVVLLGTVVSLADDPFEASAGGARGKAAKPVRKAREAKPENSSDDDPFASGSAEPKRIAPKRAAKPPALHTGVEAIEAALAKPVDCEFVETSLKEVIDYLKATMQVEIYLDSSALKEAGVDSTTPITCNFHGLRFEYVLGLVLNELQLGWTIHDDVLYIASPQKLESDDFSETRVYDVADLVVYRDKDGKRVDDFVPLTDAITSTIETKSWEDNGGTGTIMGESFGTAKVLVISQPYEVHKKIAALLAEIRSIAAKKSGGDELPRLRRHGSGLKGGMGMGGWGGASGMGPGSTGTSKGVTGVAPSKPAETPAGTKSSGDSPSPGAPAKK